MPMPTEDPEPGDQGPDDARPAPRERARRITQERGGPTLIEGPVEIVGEDGTTIRSDRPVVALCTCRRSRHYPFCDTSHRPRRRD
ncbi:CDGSH iron-sulfur domain-containing protein [Streptomyces sp. SBT349]|uniref:CDGSH iron-sulfur domain-containing protein n=1 Tax=Streptomyces sp. SBT349 TaxID=1580539 RepID=UPI00069FE352|nr:CDGSH iron-sulfur domain-containing protein [Streptomyces sp. SBT349]